MLCVNAASTITVLPDPKPRTIMHNTKSKQGVTYLSSRRRMNSFFGLVLASSETTCQVWRGGGRGGRNGRGGWKGSGRRVFHILERACGFWSRRPTLQSSIVFCRTRDELSYIRREDTGAIIADQVVWCFVICYSPRHQSCWLACKWVSSINFNCRGRSFLS